MSLSPREIQAQLDQSGDPDLASRQWDAFEKLFPKTGLNKKSGPLFLSLFGNCQTFLGWLVRDPELFHNFLESSFLTTPKNKAEMVRSGKCFFKRKDIKKELRQFRHAEYLRIMARDLSGVAPYAEIGRELSHLADVSMEFALEESTRNLEKLHGKATCHSKQKQNRCEFAILGMGKLGGEDLNFSSDVDVLFIYSSDDGTTTSGISLHEYATLLFKPVIDSLQDKTEDGFVFRVDTNLRPEGKKGPLTNSLDAMESYYEGWGTTWERSALIKARLSAGSSEVTSSFFDRLRPFIYRGYLDTSAITDIGEMKQKINQEEKKRFFKTFNVKLGEGGIREVEFFVSVFQLLYGGKTTSLQQPHTLTALQELVQVGLIDPATAKEISEAYIFLRRLENRLQIINDQQTHHLPENDRDLLAMARRMGFSGTEKFITTLHTHTRRVNQRFNELVLK